MKILTISYLFLHNFAVEMANILVASVPLSGHVNPAVPLVKKLVASGHEVRWYCGKKFRQQIESTGAKFYRFKEARSFHDNTIKTEFPKLPEKPLLRHASFYIKHVFYDNMLGQYLDLHEILRVFRADILLTDEWFTGAIPYAETKKLPWVVYCNSPLFYYDDEVPFPGAGIYPRSDRYGIHRNRIVNWMTTRLFFGRVQRYIDQIRDEIGLQPMKHFFLINNIHISRLFIKFNTRAFEFNWKNLPEQIHFVGPVIPEFNKHVAYQWLNSLDGSKPVIFITQGSVNIDNYNKLIVPSLKAVQNIDAQILVAAGKEFVEDLRIQFPQKNIIIEEFMPYALILPKVSVMITNGGFGGVITALNYGVPLVVASNSEDKPEIAARIKYFEVGINLGTGYPTPKKILHAVTEIFSNPVYKSNAMRISEDFQQHDAPAEAAKLIEEVLRTGN
ncbi:MAG TPA: glycosyltransferase [Bacteroidales bacterium]|nr:glycosyltransferase [Bacteroidales bacterium]HQI69423.1 glycosyltransferase [Bacteroidales bacterium]